MNPTFLFRAVAWLCLACARGVMITPPGGGHEAASRNIALFTAVVSTEDYYNQGPWYTPKSWNVLTDAAVSVCTARHYGSTMPFLMDFANLRHDHVAMLERLGWEMRNVTNSIGMWQSKYKPIYWKEQAEQENRPWTDQKVQHRKDGWATYFKFKAWIQGGFDKILIADADIIWKANPDPILQKALAYRTTFDAFPEKNARKEMGLNTRLMVITPSQDTYVAIVNRASSGDYIPFTNTEQDVLEKHFPFHENETGKIVEQFEHRHTHAECVGTLAELAARVQTCEDIWRACKESHQHQGTGAAVWKDAISEPLW